MYVIKNNKIYIILISIFYFCITLSSLHSVDINNISYDKNLTGYKYPFKVKNYKFQSQGKNLEMAYMHLMSNHSSKKVVTLLHGKNFNGAYWEETAKTLHDKGYEVIIPDQIGFGKSSKPTDYQYSFEALANNTKNLLVSLNIKSTYVVGHSMGGMLASRFGLLYPDLTEKVTLVNPIGLENYLKYVEYKDINFFYKNELKLKPENIINYQRKYYYDGEWNKRYEALTLPLVGWINSQDHQILAKVSALAYNMIFTGPVIEEFKNFLVPVSIIIGTRDRTGPGRGWKRKNVDYELGRYDRLGKQVKKRNPRINIINLDNIGHLPHIEDFKTFFNALENTL
ncbi:MAG: alpha/beta hydrolase [Alphaproteobacteria bacterium TMED93]|nr:MAG: alpha/beta hydrolase [Alphaproteobacteria bacterium TMED93]